VAFSIAARGGTGQDREPAMRALAVLERVRERWSILAQVLRKAPASSFPSLSFLAPATAAKRITVCKVQNGGV